MTLAVLDAIRAQRTFGQRRARVRASAFLLVYVIMFAAFPFGGRTSYGWWFAAAVAAAVSSLASAAFLPWVRLPAIVELGPLLLYLASVAALREAHGGAASGYAPMVMLAVIWVAVFGSRWIVALVVLAVGFTLGLPALVAHAPDYPPGELRRALLTTLVAATVAVVIRTLVRALAGEFDRRERAEGQLMQLRASEIHDDIVQSLTVAQIGLSLDDRETTDRALGHALASAQAVVAEMLDASGTPTRPGTLRRREAPSLQLRPPASGR